MCTQTIFFSFSVAGMKICLGGTYWHHLEYTSLRFLRDRNYDRTEKSALLRGVAIEISWKEIEDKEDFEL